MKTLVFIINGAHKLSSLNQQIITACQKYTGFDTAVFKTNYEKHASELAEQQTADNIDCIIAIGGDGTIHEILNGILSQGIYKPRLAILPNGTGNDFMRTRDHFKSAHQFIHSILSSNFESIDIGKITSNSSTHYFINIADIGFGGAVIHTLKEQRKLFSGKLAYSIAILKTFFTYKKSLLSITASNYQLQSEIFMVVFCNGSIFGNGLTIHPGAKVNDGQLNIVIIGNVSILDYLRYLPKLKKGQIINHPEVHYLDTNKININTTKQTWTEADGEIIGNQPITVELIPHLIELIIP